MSVLRAIGRPGALEALEALFASASTSVQDFELGRIFGAADSAQAAEATDELVREQLVSRRGRGIGLTPFGVRALLLARALNGADLGTVIDALRRLDPTAGRYVLVQEGMRTKFLEDLVSRPGFGRLYLCSPWIRMEDREAELLQTAVLHNREPDPEILVLTRPVDNLVPAGARVLQQVGGKFFLNGGLHTKLYIREPGRRGGVLMAIVGSENLTRSRYLELGIKVQGDSQLVSQLVRYFLQVTAYSTEVA